MQELGQLGHIIASKEKPIRFELAPKRSTLKLVQQLYDIDPRIE